jgi:hypothetical protein
MDTALPDACVRGYEPLIASLMLPDPDDRHVLAVAIRARAQVIVTFNEKHFPDAELAGFDITTQHPDVFLRHLVDLDSATVRACVQSMLGSWRNPPTTPEEFCSFLERGSLPDTAAALRELFGAN